MVEDQKESENIADAKARRMMKQIDDLDAFPESDSKRGCFSNLKRKLTGRFRGMRTGPSKCFELSGRIRQKFRSNAYGKVSSAEDQNDKQ